MLRLQFESKHRGQSKERIITTKHDDVEQKKKRKTDLRRWREKDRMLLLSGKQ